MLEFFKKYFKYFLLAALIYMPLFGHMEAKPFRLWDESRLAVNALEMHENGNYLVTHFRGKPDMWNTKPPLLIWCQVIGMKIFGVGEFAVRLPSALAALFTCIALLVFALRYLKSFWFGFIVIMVLITTQGYIGKHVVRTGDYDAMLILFTTVSGLFFYAFCETNKQKHLYAFFGCLTLAALTKGIAGLMFIPAMALFALLQKQVWPLLKNKHFYIGLLGFLVLVVGYYLLREAYNPGYLAEVQENELGGRYMEVQEKNTGPWWYYLDWIAVKHYRAWHFALPLGILLGLLSKNKRLRKLTLFASIMSTFYLVVISGAQTKLAWYNAPLFPFFALLVGAFIWIGFEHIRRHDWGKWKPVFTTVSLVYLLLIVMHPYREVWNKTYMPKEIKWDIDHYQMSYYLRGATRGYHDVDGKFITHRGSTTHFMVYLNQLKKQGVSLEFKYHKRLEKGDEVIAQQKKLRQYIEANYDFRVQKRWENVKVYEILGPKSHEI